MRNLSAKTIAASIVARTRRLCSAYRHTTPDAAKVPLGSPAVVKLRLAFWLWLRLARTPSEPGPQGLRARYRSSITPDRFRVTVERGNHGEEHLIHEAPHRCRSGRTDQAARAGFRSRLIGRGAVASPALTGAGAAGRVRG